MAERYRSKHGGRDTDRILGEEGEPTEGGREGGDLARDIGTRDQLKRAFERPAGATRVRGEDKPDRDRED
ncbi:MAG: hypothetical protein ACU0DT_16905 [Albimonas sp.]|uniref:hypothetical protein n=1 Tax=Albimonas sp. TaxID=1872425 RepID=UPI0040565284|tara:strand:+ start:373 stop:582 length:210 start_codon:yes stop_codon:yes gene_type:complete